MLRNVCAKRISSHRSPSCCAALQSITPKSLLQRRWVSASAAPVAPIQKLRIRNVPDSPRGHEGFLKAATWLAPDPSKVQPSDVIRELAKIGSHPESQLASIVLLATPSFTQWFDWDNDFPRDAVQQLLATTGLRLADSRRIRTKFAIVDRIPSDTGTTTRIASSNTGTEGICILLMGKSLQKSRSYRKADEKGALSRHIRFVSPPRKGNQFIIALPVANTLFRNGNPHTIFEDGWRLDDQGRPRRLYRNEITAFDVPVRSPKQATYVGMPLIPLTRPREVVTSMGNIIRELKEGDSGKVFPASAELEIAVPQLLKSDWLTEAARTDFSVYALVAKTNLYEHASKDTAMGRNPPARRHLLKDLFTGSAQMLRVTGGGGGWGNRAGLLSLAPAEDLLTDASGQASDIVDEGEEHKLQGASAPVHPGDNVQFFATVPGPQFASSKELNSKESTFLQEEAAGVDGRKSTITRIIIGTNPPEEQYPASNDAAESSEGNLIFLPDCFGMLSESGSCLGSARQEKSTRKDVIKFSSRLDIPYTTLVLDTAPHPAARASSAGDVRERKSSSVLNRTSDSL